MQIETLKEQNEQKRSELQKVVEAFSIKNMQTCISAGDSYTLGLRTDGTVVVAGYIDEGHCEISEWEDIVAISTNGGFFVHTAGRGFSESQFIASIIVPRQEAELRPLRGIQNIWYTPCKTRRRTYSQGARRSRKTTSRLWQ